MIARIKLMDGWVSAAATSSRLYRLHDAYRHFNLYIALIVNMLFVICDVALFYTEVGLRIKCQY